MGCGRKNTNIYNAVNNSGFENAICLVGWSSYQVLIDNLDIVKDKHVQMRLWN